MSEESNSGVVTITCPKCGHTFQHDAAWIKVSAMIGCPNCSELIKPKPEGSG